MKPGGTITEDQGQLWAIEHPEKFYGDAIDTTGKRPAVEYGSLEIDS